MPEACWPCNLHGFLLGLCVLFWWTDFHGHRKKWERAASSENEEEGKENAKNPVTTEKFMGSLFWLTLQVSFVDLKKNKLPWLSVSSKYITVFSELNLHIFAK